jgi:hypothetical protein
VVTRQPSWRLTSSWNTPSCNSTQLQSRTSWATSTEEPQITSCE